MKTDAQIIRTVLRGDTALFSELVDRYLPMVRGVCSARVGDPATVDDLVQESFVACFKSLNKLRRPDRFGPWLATITRNTCKSYHRSASRRSAAHDRLAQEPTPAPVTPAEVATREELYGWVHQAIASLPVKTREAMVLRYVEGLTTAEAARQCGVRESAIKKRLQYGRQLIGEKLWTELAERPRPTDDPRAKQRILKALPLAAAPWLATGKAAAAVGGGFLSAKTIAYCLVALILVGGMFAVRNNPLIGPATSSPPSPLGHESTTTMDGEESNVREAVEWQTTQTARGSLTIQVHFAGENKDNNGNPKDSGIPVAGVEVRVIPLRVDRDKVQPVADKYGLDVEFAEAVVRDAAAPLPKSLFQNR